MKKAYLNPNNNPFSKWNQADLVSETYQTAAVNEEKLRAKTELHHRVFWLPQ